MGIRLYNPVTAGRRGASVSDFAELTKGARPEKSLLVPLRKKGGRNNQGRITVRHRGGGHKQQYRVIDFIRNKDGVQAKVASIQYDPSRNARTRSAASWSSAIFAPPCRRFSPRTTGRATQMKSRIPTGNKTKLMVV